MSYLIVRGTLHDDRFVPRRGREADTKPEIPVNDELVRLQLRDRQDRVVADVGTEITEVADVRGPDVGRWLRGTIELVQSARRLVITNDGLVVHDVQVARRPPRVVLDDVAVRRDVLRLRWSTIRSEDVRSRVALVMADGRTVPLARDLVQTSGSFDLSGAPSGRGVRAIVVVSDGVRSGVAASRAFAVRGRPPQCVIVQPGSLEDLEPYQPVTLQGHAREADGARLPERGLVWYVDGIRAASGGLITTGPLQPGRHEIELRHRLAAQGTARLSGVVRDASAELAAILDAGLPDEFWPGSRRLARRETRG